MRSWSPTKAMCSPSTGTSCSPGLTPSRISTETQPHILSRPCRASATPLLPLSSATSPHAFQQELVHVYTVQDNSHELRDSVDRGLHCPRRAQTEELACC